MTAANRGPTNRTMSMLGKAAERLLPYVDAAASASVEPFTSGDIIRPNQHSKRYGWMHYGIFIPSLPDPHRYLNIMTFLGQTGTLCFDNDYLVTGDPRQTATLLTSTAAAGAHHYRAYDMRTECDLRGDGSHVGFGKDLSISGTYPHWDVGLHTDTFGLAVSVKATDVASWFVRTPIYDHVSLLSTYDGVLTYDGKASHVSGNCTFEYARCVSPHSLMKRNLPDGWKLPIDFFTYQVINLDAETQLLLTDVRLLGNSIAKTLHVRRTDGTAEVYEADVRFQVLEYHSQPLVSPDGRTMRRPRTIAWRVSHEGRELLAIDGEVDSPFRHGHGQGYVTSYRFFGLFEGREVEGRGYMEYIDCQS